MSKPVLRLSSVGDLVSLVPQLLGFEPQESVVFIGIADGRLAVTARVSIDEVTVDDLDEVMLKLERQIPGIWFVPIIFSDSDQKRFVQHLMRKQGKQIEHLVTVTGSGAWVSSDGETGRVDPNSDAVQRAAAAGLRSRGSRADMEALLDPVPGTEPQPMRVDFATLLPQLRGEDLEQWLDAARTTQAPDAIGMAGLAAWMRGDGALMNVCLERLPKHHLLWTLLDTINVYALPPEKAADVIAMATSVAREIAE